MSYIQYIYNGICTKHKPVPTRNVFKCLSCRTCLTENGVIVRRKEVSPEKLQEILNHPVINNYVLPGRI